MWRFIEGLTYGIKLQMAKEAEIEISFTQVVEIARRIKHIRGQARQTTFDESPRNFGGFSGASRGGKGTFGRGHPIRPIKLALYVTQGASDSRSAYGINFEQPAFSASPAYIIAPPIQSYYNGYLSRQGQSQIQLPCQPRIYFECGDTGHIKRYYPRLQSSMP